MLAIQNLLILANLLLMVVRVAQSIHFIGPNSKRNRRKSCEIEIRFRFRFNI